jgi:poly-gamma-glutamate capsule biosynthesis protein CapA/YwtB (metallophosphatase superfamily)
VSTRTKQNRALAGVCGVAIIALVAMLASATGSAPDVPVANAESARPQAQPEPAAAPASEAQVATAPPAAKGISVAAVGDIVMGTPQFGLPPANGSTLFSRVKPLLTGDVVVGNLEEALATGPSAKCAGSAGGTCYAFASPPSYARNLTAAGFTAVNIANNHSYDWGPAGMRSTVRALDAVGLLYTGRPGEIAVQTTAGGTKVAFIGLAPYSWSQNALDIPGAVRLVRKAAKMAPIVIVNAHVGAEGARYRNVPRGMETYLGEPRGETRRLAHSVIDAGADMFVGHGPHVMRGMEFRKGRLIAYSLGNFLGYKTFNTSGYSGMSGVLQARLANDGRFESGRIAPVRLDSTGVPSPGGSTARDVAQLSRADFGRNAARVAPNGAITAP